MSKKDFMTLIRANTERQISVVRVTSVSTPLVYALKHVYGNRPIEIEQILLNKISYYGLKAVLLFNLGQIRRRKELLNWLSKVVRSNK